MKKAVLIGALLACIDRLMICEEDGKVQEITMLVDMNGWKWAHMSTSAATRVIEVLQVR